MLLLDGESKTLARTIPDYYETDRQSDGPQCSIFPGGEVEVARRNANVRNALRAGLLLLALCLLAERDQIASYISSLDDLTRVLSTISDVPGAKSAEPKLDVAIVLYISFRDQVRKLSFDQRKDRNKEMQEAYLRMTDQVKRLRGVAEVEKELHATLARLD